MYTLSPQSFYLINATSYSLFFSFRSLGIHKLSSKKLSASEKHNSQQSVVRWYWFCHDSSWLRAAKIIPSKFIYNMKRVVLQTRISKTVFGSVEQTGLFKIRGCGKPPPHPWRLPRGAPTSPTTATELKIVWRQWNITTTFGAMWIVTGTDSSTSVRKGMTDKNAFVGVYDNV